MFDQVSRYIVNPQNVFNLIDRLENLVNGVIWGVFYKIGRIIEFLVTMRNIIPLVPTLVVGLTRL